MHQICLLLWLTRESLEICAEPALQEHVFFGCPNDEQGTSNLTCCLIICLTSDLGNCLAV